MAKKKTIPKKYKKGTLGHLRLLFSEVIIPAYLDDMMAVFMTCAERAKAGWPWFTGFHNDHGVPGYSTALYLDVDPSQQTSLSGDAKIRFSVTVSMSEDAFTKLVVLLSKPPTEERHKHDYAHEVGRILMEATECASNVTCSMTERDSARAVAHCERYMAVAKFGLQLEDVFRDHLYPAPVAKFVFDAWEAS